MRLSKNALRVLERRYLKKDKNGKVIEKPEDLFRRVANAIAQAEFLFNKDVNKKKVKEIEETFYKMMVELDWLPNSPCLFNAGREYPMLSACFTLPVPDTMEGIFGAVKDGAMIFKYGGGVGFSFSSLRPKGDRVDKTEGSSSGPISFMSVFNSMCQTVVQGGRRRGAMMGILRVDHPDILEFIKSKESGTTLTNFNISVAVTNKFMKAVEKNKKYDLANPHTNKKTGSLNAREVFNLIVEMAHKNGDPGLFFIDEVNKYNPTPQMPIESSNPCNEVPLLPYESCNLGSINLSHMVKEGKIDYEKLKTTITNAIRFLDNVIEVNKFPLPQIREVTRANRKIGLGIMGFADLLVKLNVSYSSKKAIAVAEEVMKFINKKAKEVSIELAKERGPFPNIKESIYKDEPIRNATRTVAAPTGSLSIIANCSAGIEPYFGVSFVRNIMDKDHLIEVNPLFEKIAKEKGFYSKELMEKIAKKGSVTDIEKISQKVRKIFVTAHEVSHEQHIKIQAAFQKHIDLAVSKTINLPESATTKDVEKAFLFAWKSKCKGITVYRDKSKAEQVLNIGAVNIKSEKLTPRKRPGVTHGTTTKVVTACGSLFVTVNRGEDGKVFEVFTQMGRAGGCATSQLEAISRVVSLALRAGIELPIIIDQLKGIRCPSPLIGKNRVLSCADAIATVLEGPQHKEPSPVYSENNKVYGIVGVCPDCGDPLRFEGERCISCKTCGYTRCG